MSKGGKVYGVNVGNSEPRTLLYFNKRVLKDVGIDPESIYDMQPEDGAADYYKDAFKSGFCGFCVHWAYAGFNDNNEFMDMADEYGAVAFPIGPKGDTYVTVVSDVVIVIPNVYDAETVGKLAFMYGMYTRPALGYEEDDEPGLATSITTPTNAPLTKPMPCSARLSTAAQTTLCTLAKKTTCWVLPLLWRLNWNDPGELVEAAMPVWQTLCDTFNGD